MKTKPNIHHLTRKPLLCKYCRRYSSGISYYLAHQRRHKFRINPYWYQNHNLPPKVGLKSVLRHRSGIKAAKLACFEPSLSSVKIKCSSDHHQLPHNQEKMSSIQGGLSHNQEKLSSVQQGLFHNQKKLSSIQQGWFDVKECSSLIGSLPPQKDQVKFTTMTTANNYLDYRVQDKATHSVISIYNKASQAYKEIIWQCKHCNKIFQSAQDMIQHERTLWKNMCRYCEKTFQTKKEKSVHERTVHDFAKIKCIYCSRTFTKMDDPEANSKCTHRNHGQKHALFVNLFNCEHCEMGFTCQADLKDHSITETCEHCNMSLKCHFVKQQHHITCKYCKKSLRCIYAVAKQKCDVAQQKCKFCKKSLHCTEEKQEHGKRRKYCKEFSLVNTQSKNVMQYANISQSLCIVTMKSNNI